MSADIRIGTQLCLSPKPVFLPLMPHYLFKRFDFITLGFIIPLASNSLIL